MGIGETVRQLRKSIGLTQEELAPRIGLSSGHLSKLERNEHDPSLATLRALVHVLDVKAWEDLLGPVDGVKKSVMELEQDAMSAAALAHQTPIGSHERERARQMFRAYAAASSPELAAKLSSQASLPSSKKKKRKNGRGRAPRLIGAPRKNG